MCVVPQKNWDENHKDALYRVWYHHGLDSCIFQCFEIFFSHGKSISESALLIFFQVHKWNGENLQRKNDAKREMKMDALDWVTKKGFQSKYGILYRGRKHSIVFENSTCFSAKLCALLHGNWSIVFTCSCFPDSKSVRKS